METGSGGANWSQQGAKGIWSQSAERFIIEPAMSYLTLTTTLPAFRNLKGGLFLIVGLFPGHVHLAAQPLAPNVRIVDNGADVGSGYYRNTSSTASSVAVDVDGDGQTSDDSLAYWKFSFSEPMNPKGIHYDEEASNAIFYGGITGWFASPGKTLIEGLLNENHERRDDFNMMIANTPQVPNRICGLWFWVKNDFLNGGSQYTVSFDQNSLLAPHISRYFNGLDSGRWVVREGTQFFVSEKTFGQYQAENGRASPLHTTYQLQPLATRWAPFNPQEPYLTPFDAANAVWEQPPFQNVTAVGMYIYRDTLSNEDVGLKWNSYEAYAVVQRPAAPAYHADMVTVPAGQFDGAAMPSFDILRTEVPYTLWKRVWKWAVSNQYCLDLSPGYTFNRDGDMGSMDAGSTSHEAGEPATDLTWQDAVLWCNALTELEGRRPAYYTDASLTTVLREIQGRYLPADYNRLYAVQVDWTADGYRLPTPAEWAYAATSGSGSLDFSAGSAWTAANSSHRTHACGALAANTFGLRDTAGHVWEWVWDTPNASAGYDPVTQTGHTVLGGDFRHPSDPAAGSYLPYGEEPMEGSPTIGFRFVRSPGVPPTAGAGPGAVPSWSFTRGQVIPPVTPPPATRTPVIASQLVYLQGTQVWGRPEDSFYESDNLGFQRSDGAFVTVTPFWMSRTEITFAQWNEVYQWARRQGYIFDFDGDLGSMDWRTEARETHQPTEPVTQISWNDAVVWCNALSEYEGLQPVYFADPDRTQVLRQSNRWRNSMDMRPGYVSSPAESDLSMEVYPRWEKDGYRLPTGAEWEASYREGNQTAAGTSYPWAGGASVAEAQSWVRANSGGRTHPAGTATITPLGLHDLAGNVTEWCWDWPGTDYYKPHNPKGSTTPDNLFGKMLRGGNFGWEPYTITGLEQERESAPRAYFGFRVVRCEADRHPENEVFQPPIVVDLEAADFNLHQDQMYRYNNHRTGSTDRTGVPDGPVGARWTYSAIGPFLSSPVMVDGRVYLGNDDGYFYCLDATSGAEVWKVNTGKVIRSSAAVVEGRVFFSAGEYLYCLDALTGTQSWRFTRGNVTQNNVAPAVAYGIVYSAFGSYSMGAFSGVRIADGQEVWRFRLGWPNQGPMGPTLDGLTFYAPYNDNKIMGASLETEYYDMDRTGHHCQACLTINDADSLLYIRRGDVTSINRLTGNSEWFANLGGAFDDRPEASMALGDVTLADNTVERRAFVGILDGGLHCLEAHSGARRWNINLGGPVKSSPTLCRNVIYIGTDDGRLLAINAADGTTRWSYMTGTRITGSPWVSDGVVFVANQAGQVMAVAAGDSVPVIATTSLTGASQFESYSFDLQVVSGDPPIVWSLVSGSLPPGVTLSTTGRLQGAPQDAGSFVFSVRVTDGDGDVDEQSLTLTVAAYVDLLPQISTTTLPAGQVGQTYVQTLTATGGNPPLTWSLAAGVLPADLSLSAAGLLTGLPAETGSFSITVRVTDADGDVDDRALTLDVALPPLGAPLAVVAAPAHSRRIILSWQDNAAAETGYAVERRDITAGSLPEVEIILDNSRQNEVGSGTVTGTGFYGNQKWVSGWYGTDWSYRDCSDTGTAEVKYLPTLTGLAGSYEVFVWFPRTSTNLTTNQPIEVNHDGGLTTVVVDANANTSLWFSLGTYQLSDDAWVRIHNRYSGQSPATTKRACADAVRFHRASGAGPWQMLADNLAANTTRYVDDAVEPGHIYEYRVRALQGATYSPYGEIGTATTPTADPSFAGWADSLFAGGAANPDADPNADPDRDGISNLMEYALASQPNTAETAATLPELKMEAGQFNYRFRREMGRTDLRYRVEVGSDLANWTTLVWDSETDSSPNNDGTHQIVPLPTIGPKLFVHLRVSLNP